MRFVMKVAIVLIGSSFLPPADAPLIDTAAAVLIVLAFYEAGRRLARGCAGN